METSFYSFVEVFSLFENEYRQTYVIATRNIIHGQLNVFESGRLELVGVELFSSTLFAPLAAMLQVAAKPEPRITSTLIADLLVTDSREKL